MKSLFGVALLGLAQAQLESVYDSTLIEFIQNGEENCVVTDECRSHLTPIAVSMEAEENFIRMLQSDCAGCEFRVQLTQTYKQVPCDGLTPLALAFTPRQLGSTGALLNAPAGVFGNLACTSDPEAETPTPPMFTIRTAGTEEADICTVTGTDVNDYTGFDSAVFDEEAGRLNFVAAEGWTFEDFLLQVPSTCGLVEGQTEYLATLTWETTFSFVEDEGEDSTDSTDSTDSSSSTDDITGDDASTTTPKKKGAAPKYITAALSATALITSVAFAA